MKGIKCFEDFCLGFDNFLVSHGCIGNSKHPATACHFQPSNPTGYRSPCLSPSVLLLLAHFVHPSLHALLFFHSFAFYFLSPLPLLFAQPFVASHQAIFPAIPFLLSPLCVFSFHSFPLILFILHVAFSLFWLCLFF